MDMHPVPKNKAAAKQGIALIVVLSLLAMLVIMSVSFVVFMRAERTASSDYAEFVKARNIAQAGLSRALLRMGQEMMPPTSNQFYHGGAFYVTGPGEVCSNWLPSGYANLNFYVPSYGPFNTALNEAQTLGRCRWTNMTIKSISSGATMLVGRYSYIVMDCSDFLDINTISNSTFRGNGNYPDDVAMPPDDVKIGANLKTMRQQHLFESLCEVNLRNSYGPAFNTAPKYQPQHLVTYSYVPVDAYFTNNALQGRLYISTNATGTGSIKAQVAAIKTMTAKLGFDPAFADNLADFVDTTTDVPTNPNEMGGGKQVPMLYQVAATNGLRRVTIGGLPVWELETRVIYETWFPYPMSAGKSYSVKLSTVPKVAISASVPPVGPSYPWLIVTNGYEAALGTTPAPGAILTPTNSFGSNSYVIVYRSGYTGTLSTASSTLTLPPNAYVMNGAGGGGSVVDQAAFPTLSVLFTAAAGAAVPAQGWGVVDPRINYRTTDWRKNTKTLLTDLIGRTNEFCDVKGSKYDGTLPITPDNNGDGTTFMYARRPGIDPSGLYNMGDLGYLLYRADKPWHTVRLTTPQNVLKDNSSFVFNMLSAIPTNHVYQGFVNPNSQDTNALLCAFLGASKARYYGEPNAQNVDFIHATQLAQALINKGCKLGAKYAYTNIADICRLCDYNIVGSLYSALSGSGATAPDLWQQKAVMGNCIGLLNPRQNYWLVLVCAQAVKTTGAAHANYTPATDFVTAEVQCLAYIWRDPFEDPTDTVHAAGQRRHKMFVQFFKWL